MKLRYKLMSMLFTAFFAPSVPADVPTAYRDVANEYGVPAELLYAIALTESRYSLGNGISRPWPWTANVEGKPYYGRSKSELTAYLKKLLQQGNKRFDVGLMQISWRHHESKFENLDQAIDPYQNLKYGAAYLRSLRKKHGSYDLAVGMYHTGERGPLKRQREYKQRVWDSLQRIREGQV